MSVIFDNYKKPEELLSLCEAIDMPAEVAAMAGEWIRNADYSAVKPYFEGLFSLDTGKQSTDAIRDWAKAEDDTGIKALAVYLAAALHTREICREKGISDAISYDSMKAFSRFVKEHKASYGRYGFDRDFWIYRQLSGSLFRLGELEFEMCQAGEQLAEAIGPHATADMPVLSVHIPSDAVMTRESLDHSYSWAKEFFSQYFPGFDYGLMYCHTWLLAPALKELLPTHSRILAFQSDYELLLVEEDDRSFMGWVYKREYDDIKELPEDTSLMRAIKARLLAGGKIGGALGIVKGSVRK